MIDIKRRQDYNPLDTKYLAIHHTGGLGTNALASTQHLTAENIDAAHMARFDMLSTLRRWGGYNFFIEKDGKITQFRAIGEETAAVKGYNFGGLCISICLAGNFTPGVDKPTSEQIEALRKLYALLPQVAKENIVAHRILQQTACYGAFLSDKWAQDLLAGHIPNTQLIAMLRAKIVELRRKLRALLRRNKLGGALDCHQTNVIG